MDRTDYASLLVLFATLFLAVADNQILSPLLPVLSAELQVSIQRLGQLVTVYALASGLVAFVLSPWSDRLGRTVLMRWALLLFALASLICSRSDGFLALLSGRILVGVAAGVLSFNVLAYVGDRFAYAERGRAMGIVYSAYFAALVAGVPLGSWIAAGLGWKAVFLSGALVAACLYIVVVTRLPAVAPPAASDRTATSFAGRLRAAGRFLTVPASRRGVASSFLVSGGMVSLLTYLGAWLSHAHGMSTTQIGSIFMLAGLAALTASPLCGYLSDRVGKRRVFLAGNLALAGGMLLLPWVPAGLPLLVLFFVISLSAALRQSPFEAIITELVPGEFRGRYIALRNMFSQLGIACCVLLSGLLHARYGYAAVALFAGIVTAVAGLLVPKVADCSNVPHNKAFR